MNMLLPKMEIIRDRKYLNWVRTQPCILTGHMGEDVDPAHIRYGLSGGIGMKPSDDLVVPLTHALHMEQHNTSESLFWSDQMHRSPSLAMDCLKAYARLLYRDWKGK